MATKRKAPAKKKPARKRKPRQKPKATKPQEAAKPPAPAVAAQPEPNTPEPSPFGIPGKKATKAIAAARVDAIESLIIAGATRSQILQYAATNWEGKKRQTGTYVARATQRIHASAAYDHTHELGLAVRRAHYLFQAAMKVRDFRLGATVERDRRKLLGLDQPERIMVEAEHTGTVTIEDADRLTRMTLEELEHERLRLKGFLGENGRPDADHDPARERPN
jgi:hypothetical protein